MVTRGLNVPDVGHAYSRAQVLCQQVGDATQHCRALWGLVQFYCAQAQLATADTLGQQFCPRARAERCAFEAACRRSVSPRAPAIFLRDLHLPARGR